MKFLEENWLKLESKKRREHLRQDIGIIFQNGQHSLDPLFTIGQQLKELMVQPEPQKIIETLKMVQLEEKVLHLYPHELSGGMLQRVMVAIIIGLDAKIIVADEVTSALDSYNRYEMIKIFKELNKMGKSIILITHDYYLMKSISDRCLVMENGEVIEKFNPKLKPELIKENSEFGAKLLETTIYKRKGS